MGAPGGRWPWCWPRPAGPSSPPPAAPGRRSRRSACPRPGALAVVVPLVELGTAVALIVAPRIGRGDRPRPPRRLLGLPGRRDGPGRDRAVRLLRPGPPPGHLPGRPRAQRRADGVGRGHARPATAPESGRRPPGAGRWARWTTRPWAGRRRTRCGAPGSGARSTAPARRRPTVVVRRHSRSGAPSGTSSNSASRLDASAAPIVCSAPPSRHVEQVLERRPGHVLPRQPAPKGLGAPDGDAGEGLAVGQIHPLDPQDLALSRARPRHGGAAPRTRTARCAARR